MEEAFDTRQAAILSGLPVTMIDYLCRTNIAVPSYPVERGRGRKRMYTFTDVVILRGIAKLLDAGVGVSRLGRALNNLRKHHPEIISTSLPTPYIVTDGREVFLRRSDEVLETLATGQLAFGFVIEVARLMEEVNSELIRLRAAS